MNLRPATQEQVGRQTGPVGSHGVQPGAGALTPAEAGLLASHEGIIRRGIDYFVEVGHSLLEIRDKKLWRGEFGSFEAYMLGKWNWSARHGRRLIDASEVARNLSSMGPLVERPPESVLRPLVKLPPEKQREAWEEAKQTAAKKGKRVTAKEVKAAVDARNATAGRKSEQAKFMASWIEDQGKVVFYRNGHIIGHLDWRTKAKTYADWDVGNPYLIPVANAYLALCPKGPRTIEDIKVRDDVEVVPTSGEKARRDASNAGKLEVISPGGRAKLKSHMAEAYQAALVKKVDAAIEAMREVVDYSRADSEAASNLRVALFHYETYREHLNKVERLQRARK